MSKRMTIIEKIIASLLIIFACLEAYLLYWQINYIVEIASGREFVKKFEVSYIALLINYHSQLISVLLGFFAGLFLLLNKKTGWILAVATCLIRSIMYSYTFLQADISGDKATKPAPYLVFIGLLGIAITVLILLLQKEFRNKYQVSVKTWGIISLITILYFIDMILF